MKFLALEKEIITDSAKYTVDLLEEEARHVWSLQQEGIIREIYFNEHKCAVLILETENIDVAKNTVEKFPLVTAGLIRFEVMSLLPYSGISRLFK